MSQKSDILDFKRDYNKIGPKDENGVDVPDDISDSDLYLKWLRS